ncbi:MAG: peptidoglycan D,D-transpeptidase FtsI family protein, partial [Traorella sp.]
MQRITQIDNMKKVLIGVSVLFFIISGKLVYEQGFHHEAILEKAENLWQRDFRISGRRGSIYSSDQVVLASNIASCSVVVVPLMIKDATSTAAILSAILECDEEMLSQKIQKRVSTQKLQPEGRNISEEQRQKIIEADLEGVILVADFKRYYPYHNYLSQVLGFTGIDHQGLSGIELQYDEYLKAESGELKISFDAKGNLLNLSSEVVANGLGNNVTLTIDSKIQNIVEREMDAMMIKYEANSALAIAMDPNSGAILAMVSKPDFDPNEYQKYDVETLNRNLPIWMSFEPGSTFKSVTFASGLEEKCFDMYKDTYFDRGFEMVGGARIKSWKAGGHGLQTFLQVLENSS